MTKLNKIKYVWKQNKMSVLEAACVSPVTQSHKHCASASQAGQSNPQGQRKIYVLEKIYFLHYWYT